jgi:DNA-binding LytR/AlgR family response regulator
LLSRSVARANKLIEEALDLALLDVDVTDGKTFEVAAMLRIRQVPFVFFSGSRRDHLPDQFKDAPFIPKPYDERVLIERIREIIPTWTRRHNASAAGGDKRGNYVTELVRGTCDLGKPVVLETVRFASASPFAATVP